jgi:methyltransferase (TIGR00027 family)
MRAPAADRAHRSAAGVATLRFVSSYDDPVANPDRLVGAFLGRPLRLAVRVPPLRRAICRGVRRRFPGALEYQAARTRHLDGILRNGLASGLRQVVILGVGYDTRPYRFREELTGARVFEVDQPGTLARRGRRAGALPSVDVTRVAVNFERGDLATSLDAADFDPTLTTLFLWEGVTMFIDAAAVRRTLEFLGGAAPGSSLAFDYVARSALVDPAAHYGGPEAARHFERTGEPWRFGLEPEDVEPLLAAHGLRQLSHYGPEDLQRTYLAGAGPPSDGRVPSFHGIVHAAVS